MEGRQVLVREEDGRDGYNEGRGAKGREGMGMYGGERG